MYEAKLIQNKHQYEKQDNFATGYPEIQDDLYPGTTSSGIVCFPAMKQTEDITLYIHAHSDSSKDQLEDVIFR